MDLSIIIPCHNLQDYIYSLIETINNQKTKYSFECIFVLDDCKDETENVIIREIDSNYSIMKCCVHSCGIARNIGLEQAKGDYIWFVDGDDWLLGNDIIDVIIDNLKSEHSNRIQFEFESNFYKEKNPVMVWQYVFSREFLHGLRFSSIQPDEDAIFMRDVYNKERNNPGYPPIRFIRRPIYYYNYKRPGSNMTQINEKGRIDY